MGNLIIWMLYGAFNYGTPCIIVWGGYKLFAPPLRNKVLYFRSLTKCTPLVYCLNFP